jgi:predicted GH43/DUF377 family glycosyl hydrolase
MILTDLLAWPDLVRVDPDPDRLVFRLFVPGREEVGPGNSRAGTVIERLLRLDGSQVRSAVAAIESNFADPAMAWAAASRNLETIALRIDGFDALDPDRKRLIGAAFTHQFAVEGASVCNPSMVQAPDQPAGDDVAFVMSVRGIGEGHRSSIGFRSGHIRPDGFIGLDPSSGLVETGSHSAGPLHRDAFRRLMHDAGADPDNLAFLCDTLESRFSPADLDERLSALADQASTRRSTGETVAQAQTIAAASYGVSFGDRTTLSQRVLWPHTPSEHHGMEDARFVRFTEIGNEATYYATYTAFDGAHISMRLIETVDFVHFLMTPLTGLAASGKGLAIFPRKVNGRYWALTRANRETNSVASTEDLTCWDTSTPLQDPVEPWEILQLGNCGSPIETPAGWLVLTHGVGPMRRYAIGAILLDLDDPATVIGRTREPLVQPASQHAGGYVPNVVYSCGAMLAGDHLVVPFGVNDQRIAIASLRLSSVLEQLTSP